MDKDTRYNGWTNYETWLVNLWMDNEQYTQAYWQEQAQEAWDAADSDDRESEATQSLADSLKDHWENDANEQIPSGVFSDLIGAALGSVNWQEIAEHLISDVDRDQAEAV